MDVLAAMVVASPAVRDLKERLFKSMYLMYKDKEVIYWNDNDAEIICAQFVPYIIRKEDDSLYKNVPTLLKDIQEFLYVRALTMCNLGLLNRRLFHPGRKDSDEKYDAISIALACNGVTLLDSYWIREDDSELSWDDVNLRRKDSNKLIASISLQNLHFSHTDQWNALVADGLIPGITQWRHEGDEIYFYKVSSRKVPNVFIERSASKILDCFNVNHVQYKNYPRYIKKTACKCKIITNKYYDMVGAGDVLIYCKKNNIDFIEFVKSIDIENYAKMCIVDYLIGNCNRSVTNLAFFQDISTGELTGLCPLYDHDHAFQYGEDDFREENNIHALNECNNLSETAHEMMEKCDFRNIKLVTRKLFINKFHYDSVMNRINELDIELVK